MDTSLIVNILMQAANGIAFLHDELNIIHRDIKVLILYGTLLIFGFRHQIF